MQFGPKPPKKLPEQDPQKVLMLAERWQRAAWAHEKWATPAKQAVDFFEGRQWTEAQLAEMKRLKRPAFRFNIIAPIVRLVIGYQRSNKSDITFSPGQDGLSNDDVAETLTQLEKVIAQYSHLDDVDSEVFLEGLIAARGWFDTRLDWSTNDLGEAKTTSADPFAVYPDPDADTYDLNESAAFMQMAKFVSLDEIEGNLGKNIADLVRPWTMGQTPLAPVSSVIINDEVTPVRFFGQRDDTASSYWDSFYSLMGDHVDRHRKTIRMIETQYKVREPRNVVIDLETGDKKTLPEDWGADKIQKILLYAEQMGNPCTVERRQVERIHWTTMIGDLIVYDAPSFYEGYTQTGYFPYFRRGVTRGMVEDLVDPQLEKNKRRSARIEIESKTANGGWKYHDTSVDPVMEANIKKFGATPGFNLKWKGMIPPEQIQPAHESMGQKRLEADADEDIRRISGVNESALGETDISNQSGRAIIARQRQATISVQMYMDNFKRSKHLLGLRHLDIVQNYYTEQRIYRIKGDDGKFQQIVINQMLADPTTAAKRIVNGVTVGKYSVAVDDAPLSATFMAAQFEEMMTLLKELAPALPPGALAHFADLIIGMSSMPRKKEWIDRLQQIAQQAAQQKPEAKVSQSMNFKDLPPEGQVQMAQEAGIQITPESAVLAAAAAKAPAPQPDGSNVVPITRGA